MMSTVDRGKGGAGKTTVTDVGSAMISVPKTPSSRPSPRERRSWRPARTTGLIITNKYGRIFDDAYKKGVMEEKYADL